MIDESFAIYMKKWPVIAGKYQIGWLIDWLIDRLNGALSHFPQYFTDIMTEQEKRFRFHTLTQKYLQDMKSGASHLL